MKFNYPCGCFQMISKGGGGAGKECHLCHDKQVRDAEEYLGIKQIRCERQEKKDES